MFQKTIFSLKTSLRNVAICAKFGTVFHLKNALKFESYDFFEKPSILARKTKNDFFERKNFRRIRRQIKFGRFWQNKISERAI